MRRLAYAKLNLALSVGPAIPAGEPASGMHPVASWMHAIQLCDQLELNRLSDAQRSVYSIAWAGEAPRPTPIDWPLDKDLTVRAHRLLETLVGRTLPVSLTLSKRIPVGGGLGGGSSDAAAVMLALNQLFALGIPFAQLRDLSRSLGSDVAFFLDERADIGPPRPAVVSGLGDTIVRCRPASSDILLIIPPFPCPTGPVYKAFDSLPRARLQLARVESLTPASRPLATELFNDLLPAAALVEPALGALRERLTAAAQRPVHMSGSGSTLFVLHEASELAALTACLRAAAPEVTVLSTRLV